ncbi:MAG: uracil-DNA glycosylase family protein [Muribaculaceae bacterium]|nr:uracil-DNA glycosylase family protein [Muribaculaceae bacterium]
MTEQHPFPPFIHADSEVLILGTFPPQPKRWAFDFYYPNPTNDFWRVMGLIFYADKMFFYDATAKKFDLSRIKEFLIEHHIALSDTGVEAIRLKDNASDKFLQIVKSIDINAVLHRYPSLSYLVTTGEKAAGVLAELTHTDVPLIGEYVQFTFEGRTIRHYRMPSTSRAYPLAVEKKAAEYAKVFRSMSMSVQL